MVFFFIILVSQTMFSIGNIKAFNVDIKAIKWHTIGVSILVAVGSSLQIADQNAALALALTLTSTPTLAPTSTSLLPSQCSFLPSDNSGLKYYQAFGYYLINLLPLQYFVHQTFLPTSDILLALIQISFSAYVNLIFNSISSPTQNILNYEKRRRNSRSDQRSGQRSGQRDRSHIERSRSVILNIAGSQAPITDNNDIAAGQETDEEQPEKKGQNRHMNPKEKLILI